MRVTVIAAGFDGGEPGGQAPAALAQPRTQQSAASESSEPVPVAAAAPAAGSIWSSAPVAAPAPVADPSFDDDDSDLDISDFLK